MTHTVVEAEERYRSQLESLEKELRIEREKRSQLEKQVQQLMENVGSMVPPSQRITFVSDNFEPKKLRQSQDQAKILAGALSGLGDEDDENDSEDDADMDQSNNGSYAALQQLTSQLKVARVELTALRKSLAESEKTREKLVEDLNESRNAKERLPLFEAKVQELTQECKEQALEIQGLQEDIAEVKEMYRNQLNLLLEEKVAQPATELENTVSDMNNDASIAESNSTE
jgi:chromosome segregation ATPase